MTEKLLSRYSELFTETSAQITDLFYGQTPEKSEDVFIVKFEDGKTFVFKYCYGYLENINTFDKNVLGEYLSNLDEYAYSEFIHNPYYF